MTHTVFSLPFTSLSGCNFTLTLMFVDGYFRQEYVAYIHATERPGDEKQYLIWQGPPSVKPTEVETLQGIADAIPTQEYERLLPAW